MELVAANFIDDVRRQFVKLLVDSGFSVPDGVDAPRATQLYFNARKRRIEPRKRAVLVSRELRNKTLSLADRHGIEAVRRASELGENLNPFLSTRIEDLEWDDLLLNDWGIHHLHLGTWRRKRKKGFVGRSRTLLCVRVEPTTLHMVDVVEHKPSSQLADDSLIKTIHANWPELLERYRLNGARPCDSPYSPSQRERLRHAGVTIAVQVGDSLYAPPGGGYLTSKASAECLMYSDRLLNAARSLEWQCREKASVLTARIQEGTGRHLESLALSLRCDGQGLHVVETQTGTTLWSGTP